MPWSKEQFKAIMANTKSKAKREKYAKEQYKTEHIKYKK